MSLAAAVHEALAKAGITHAVGGAVALAIHGAPRSTTDLDFLTVDPAALRPGTWAGLPAGTAVEIRRGDLDDPLQGVVRLDSTEPVRVDVVVARSAWLGRFLETAVPAEVAGVALPIVGPAELVLLKLDAGGPRDLWDVHQLLEAREDREAIVAKVEGLVAELPQPIRESWSRLLAERAG
jgi:hypothetical protein